MTVHLEKIKFTINIKTSTLPEFNAVATKANSASPMDVVTSVDVRGSRAIVYIEVEGLDRLQLISFQEWAEDFAKGLYY